MWAGRPWSILPVALALGFAAQACLAQPPIPEARGATRVVVLSDFNESYGSTRYSTHVDEAVARAVSLKPDLVISAGDMVAGQRLAPPLDRGEMEAWRELYQLARADPALRGRIYGVILSVPLPLPRFWLAALASLGEPVDPRAPVPDYDTGV